MKFILENLKNERIKKCGLKEIKRIGKTDNMKIKFEEVK